MISNAFKGAYTNEVSQRAQSQSNIASGVKAIGGAILTAMGFTSGGLGKGLQGAIAKVGGLGGAVMNAQMDEKKVSAETKEENQKLFTSEEVASTISAQLGDNPINRNAKKQLNTVFETLQMAKEQEILNKKGQIQTDMGDIDPNSELGKQILAQLNDEDKEQKKTNLRSKSKKIMLDEENESNFNEQQLRVLNSRGVSGDSLLDANDLAREILDVGGEITPEGKVRVYHATSPENAKEINRTGQMFGKEDKIYFSTKRDGEIKGYGNAIVEAEIPIEKLQANDLFTDEIHLTLDTGVPGRMVNIREWEDKK